MRGDAPHWHGADLTALIATGYFTHGYAVGWYGTHLRRSSIATQKLLHEQVVFRFRLGFFGRNDHGCGYLVVFVQV